MSLSVCASTLRELSSPFWSKSWPLQASVTLSLPWARETFGEQGDAQSTPHSVNIPCSLHTLITRSLGNLNASISGQGALWGLAIVELDSFYHWTLGIFWSKPSQTLIPTAFFCRQAEMRLWEWCKATTTTPFARRGATCMLTPCTSFLGSRNSGGSAKVVDSIKGVCLIALGGSDGTLCLALSS